MDILEAARLLRTCSIAGCTTSEKARRLCSAHYNRWKKYGDPTAGRPARAQPGEATRFVEAVAVPFTGLECLIWPYGKYPNGYGQISTGDGTKVVSRLVCELAHGLPPTPKHEAAHSCANGHSGCVNPRHLRWATSKENKADVVIHKAAGIGKFINRSAA